MSQAKHREVRTRNLQTSAVDRIDSKCLTDRDLVSKDTARSRDHEAEQSRQRFYFIKACLLALIVCLTACFPLVAAAQSADQATLSSIAKSFFESYQKEDIDGLMKLWSEKSPEAASARQSFQQTFAANDKIEVKGLAVGKMKAEGEKATLRVVVEMSAVDSKTGKEAAGFGKQNRTFHFVKESRDWKVWQYVSSEDELAAAIVAAKTEEERKALLEADKELMTVELPRSLNNQAIRLINRGSYEKAMAISQLAQKIAEQLNDKAGIAASLNNIGNVHWWQGNYAQVLDYYHRSLKIREEIGDKTGTARTLNNIGIVHRSQGNYAQALDYYHRSLKIREEIGDKTGIAKLLYDIGFVHQSQGNYAQALNYHHRSLKIREDLSDKAGIGALLNNIGVVQGLQSNYVQALDYYHRGLKIAEEIGDKDGIARALNNIGNAHHLQGNYAQALDYYHKSLKIREELGDKDGLTAPLNNIGNVHHLQGNYVQALDYYHKSLKIAEEIGDKAVIAAPSSNIGVIHRSQGNYAQALDYLNRSLKIAEEIGDKDGVAHTLSNIGIVHTLQGNYAESIDKASQAAILANQIGDPEVFWEARTTAGKAFRALGQIDQARQAFAEAISTIEDLRSQVAGGEQARQLFFEDKLSPYHEMVDLLLYQNNPAEALAFAERARGRVLLDVLQSGKINITRAMSSDEQQQERKLNGELVSLNTQLQRENLRQQPDQTRLNQLNDQLQKARLHYEQFQTGLFAAHPELKTQRGQMQPISVAQAGDLIPDDRTALLEFVVTENKTHLFVLTKQRGSPALNIFTINIKQKDLADRVQRFHDRIAQLDFDYQGLSRELFDLLLGQARAQLQNKSNLIIVPDGALWELPFQALQSAPKQFLIQDSAISYASSLTVLSHMRDSRAINIAAPQTLLAFGNPAIAGETANTVKSVFMDEKLGPLPEAERMVKTLEHLYGPARSKVYVGADAREDRFKSEAANYRILQLAAHGILNHNSPMYSYIVLSQTRGSNAEDGLLEAWEIMNMDLKADMIILSACETARGKIGNGEGMIGLSWAAFVAGAPTTVVSQWKVESKSTTELMVEFHRNLRLQKSKAEALRQAALKMLSSRDYKHPFYWAGFVIIGNGW